MTQERRNILDNIIQDLLGTCQVLDEVAAYWGIDELTLADIQYIESDIFLCVGCGWWCDLSEQHYDEEPLCDDCWEATDGEEDDE